MRTFTLKISRDDVEIAKSQLASPANDAITVGYAVIKKLKKYLKVYNL